MFIENPLDSELAFPILECFHIVGFVIAVSSVALVDLRLLGLILRRQSAGQLTNDTALWTGIGLIVSVFAGLLR